MADAFIRLHRENTLQSNHTLCSLANSDVRLGAGLESGCENGRRRSPHYSLLSWQLL